MEKNGWGDKMLFHVFNRGLQIALQRQWLPVEKEAIYEYAVKVIALNGLVIGICLVISILTGNFSFWCFFLLFFVPLRRKLGGFHMKKPEHCMLLSCIFYVLMLMVRSHVFVNLYVLIVCYIAMAFYGYVADPLPHWNNICRWNNHRMKRKIVLINTVILLIMCFCRYQHIYDIILWTSCAMLLFVLEKIKIWSKRLKND